MRGRSIWGDAWPAPLAIGFRERLRIAVGVSIGLGLVAAVCRAVAPGAWPWIVAPLGASAVLVFGVPASPLAQPWPVVGGNTVSALVAIGVVHLVPWPVAAVAIGTGSAVAAMLMLRCLHPPGGAAALLVLLAQVGDPRFAIFPVFANSLLLVLAAVAYNRATGKRYPQPPYATSGVPLPPGSPPPVATTASGSGAGP